jgi:hypothetical protein
MKETSIAASTVMHIFIYECFQQLKNLAKLQCFDSDMYSFDKVEDAVIKMAFVRDRE